MNEFVSGTLAMADLVAAGFFLRFARSTGDRFFLFFTAAFLLLAAQRVALVLPIPHGPLDLVFYGLRALAFLVLIAGILDKNRRNG